MNQPTNATKAEPILDILERSTEFNDEQKWWMRLCLFIPKPIMFAAALMLWSSMFTFSINEGHSMPGHLYFVNRLDKELVKGEAYKFSYHGEHFIHGVLFTKKVVGVEGDVVSIKGREIFINGVSVAVAKEYSLAGKPLAINSFQGVIPPYKFFYIGEHPDSFDSRYQMAGLGDTRDVVGHAHLLF